jgi:hypothetical protein
MEDMGAVDAAEVYRFIDPHLMREIVAEEAERVAIDARGDYYTPAEAVFLYMARQSIHPTAFGVTIDGCGERTVRVAS